MRRVTGIFCLCLLAGCETPSGGTVATNGSETGSPAPGASASARLPEPSTGQEPANQALLALPTPEVGSGLSDREQQAAFAASQAPHIYMAIQEDGSRPLSVIFAIDEARDGDLSNDPAIRLTPNDGACNPQAMRNYSFPPPYNAPVFSGDQVLNGIRADQLPAFMAIAVSEKIVGLGIRPTLQDTRPQNICTRKLWEAQLENPVQQG
ncbi:MAG: hypothetical protein AAGE80_17015 [Pseudomonadota bacterium]